ASVMKKIARAHEVELGPDRENSKRQRGERDIDEKRFHLRERQTARWVRPVSIGAGRASYRIGAVRASEPPRLWRRCAGAGYKTADLSSIGVLYDSARR